ncbi:MAG TPA: hypothetical protein VIK72_15680 [Clostridiaceae bacterium]
MLTGGALTGDFNLYKGGLHWQSIAYALWEAYISVSMAIDLLTFFREKFNKQTKLIQGLSDSSFGVYVFPCSSNNFYGYSLSVFNSSTFS